MVNILIQGCMYNIHVKDFPVVLQNPLMMANADRNMWIYISYFYVKLVKLLYSASDFP